MVLRIEKLRCDPNNLASKVLCCFLVALDGSASIPLFIVPTQGASGPQHVQYISEALPILSLINVREFYRCFNNHKKYSNEPVFNPKILQEKYRRLGEKP